MRTHFVMFFIIFIYLIIFKFNIFFSALASKMFNIKIIIICIKNFFLRNKIVKNIDCEITI